MTPESVAGALSGLGVGCGLLLVLLAMTPVRSPRVRRAGALARLVVDAGADSMSPAGLVLASVGIGLAAGLVALAVTALPVLALLAATAAGCAPVVVLRRRAGRIRAARRAAWPDAVEALVSGVRAGVALPEALAVLADRGPLPLRSAFAGFEREYRATGSFARALDRLQDRLADPVADRVVASLRIAREVGGTDLGRVLRTLADLLRADARTRGEIEARQSWTVSAARLAVAAPWLTLALLCTRPEALRAYSSPAGAALLVTAAAMSLVAYRLMVRIGRLPAEPRLVT